MLRCWIVILAVNAFAVAAPVDVVDLANAAPPEFAADALLQLASIAKTDTKIRKELIDRAFHLATAAQLHTPLIARGEVDRKSVV